jgi:hypothetical protein
LKPLSNRCLGIIIKINLTTNYQLLLNRNKVHRACCGGLFSISISISNQPAKSAFTTDNDTPHEKYVA